MTDFDLDALERALQTKVRQPRLKPKPFTREELISQLKRMANELDQLNKKYIRTRYSNSSWSYSSRYYGFTCDGHRKDDDEVTIEVLEKLVASGQRRLKSYHDMINNLMVTNPELALEANLEGRTGIEVLEYGYNQRVNQIEEYLRRRLVVNAPSPNVFIRFNIGLDMGGKIFYLKIESWLYRHDIVIDGVNIAPKGKEEMNKLMFFIKNINQVLAEIGKQISQIKIVKEETK